MYDAYIPLNEFVDKQKEPYHKRSYHIEYIHK